MEKDVLVLPMDITKFDSHQKCVDKVIQHFEKVFLIRFSCSIIYDYILLSWIDGDRIFTLIYTRVGFGITEKKFEERPTQLSSIY